MSSVGVVRYGHHGTGFVTYDRRWGAVVHTSKHVVLDPYEAQHTDVIFFCDRDGEGVTVRTLSRRPDMTFTVYWALNIKQLSLSLSLHLFLFLAHTNSCMHKHARMHTGETYPHTNPH